MPKTPGQFVKKKKNDVFEVYFKQNNQNIIFTTIFATFYFEIAVKWSKWRIFENSSWIMLKTPGQIHLYIMVKIDTIVFEIVGGAFKATPPRIVNCLKWPGSDRVKKN